MSGEMLACVNGAYSIHSQQAKYVD